VARYIALSDFSRNKLLSAGLPPDRVVVKPNFAEDVHGPNTDTGSRSGGLFVGRLSEEKGVGVLAEAWQELDLTIKVTSDGPSAESLRNSSGGPVHLLGYVTEGQVAAAMRAAAFLVVPSLVYEGFPMVVAEAYAAGLPVIGSRLGALGELVEDGITGLHFTPGDARDLAAKVRWAASHPEQMAEMGRRARRVYERKYTPGQNYVRLMEIYEEARQTFAPQARQGVQQTKWSST
jgi:glycosyltransferase involved in cell wall biosynthesis